MIFWLKPHFSTISFDVVLKNIFNATTIGDDFCFRILLPGFVKIEDKVELYIIIIVHANSSISSLVGFLLVGGQYRLFLPLC